MCADIEYSDQEAEVDMDAYKTEQLAFGKYKGCTFEHMIKTRRTREYLKYLLKWDELKSVTREHIRNALDAYDNAKKLQMVPTNQMASSIIKKDSQSPKRKRPARTNE
jgi:hypothetical protein